MVAAIGPAIYLLCYIYKQDKIEKEPTKMLVQLFFLGCLAGVIACVLEEIGTVVLNKKKS
jgi:RsiW-degrading membrane proteinase PrsW (M82 family)